MRILVIAPHLDDEVLGVGGTIIKHIEAGDEVNVIVVANREYNNHFNATEFLEELKDAESVKEYLGYKEFYFLDYPDAEVYKHFHEALVDIENIVDKVQPEIVYTCFGGDVHQDHKSVFDMTMIIFRPFNQLGVKRILVYETPSCTDQSLPAFQPNVFRDITSVIEKKLHAIAHYRREKRSFPHPRSEGMIKMLAGCRGAQSGFVSAEAFILIRERIWDE
jgi:LmbE family N-acetylglucosaminyl deacetylase